jgi:light-regulated signal transduction histidine kinase (bacteriophytochrome)
VDGFSRILLEDYADQLDDEGRRVLDVIRNNTQNMGRLIDDLLAFSRLGRKQIEPSSVDVSELAREVFAQLETGNGHGSPQLNINGLPPAHGDRALLRQVFVNLLSNAAKYSKPAASPVIEVGGRSEDGENIYYVRDNGVGFDMKYVDKLFGVFQRLHSAEEFEGTGVGLAIVQRIVQRHGGRVWAEGRLNEGATFYFTLPKNGEKHDGRLAE